MEMRFLCVLNVPNSHYVYISLRISFIHIQWRLYPGQRHLDSEPLGNTGCEAGKHPSCTSPSPGTINNRSHTCSHLLVI